MPHTPPAVPAFTNWPSFPLEGEFRVKKLDDPVAVEPPRKGEGSAECTSCSSPDDAYIWVSERWRVRAMDRPSGLPAVLILESRSHLDLGDLPNLLAAELGVMTVRLERAIRSLDGVARVHVNRWGDGSAHLHMWFLARPYGRLQLRGTFLSLWDDILPPIPETQWRENLALVAAWLAEFGGRPLAEPPRIQWQAPSSLTQQEARAASAGVPGKTVDAAVSPSAPSDAVEKSPSGMESGAESLAGSRTAPGAESQPTDAAPGPSTSANPNPNPNPGTGTGTGTPASWTAAGVDPASKAVSVPDAQPVQAGAVAVDGGTSRPAPAVTSPQSAPALSPSWPSSVATGEQREPEGGAPLQR